MKFVEKYHLEDAFEVSIWLTVLVLTIYSIIQKI